MTGSRTLTLALATALTVSAVGCGLLRSHPPPPLNVVVVTLDTTRADRLSPYGYMDVSMPGLERLAREGAVFHRAFTTVPLTLPAHTSLFTGLSPASHGVRDNADPPLDGEIDTLADVLRGAGYQTAAFVASAVLDAERGLAQGFDRYQNSGVDEQGRRVPQRRGDVVINEAIAWLDQAAPKPFLLWTHLYDAHQPYDAPEPFGSQISDRYIAEIVFADAQVLRLLDAIERRGLTERTVVVVLADHGESLGDHGERDHGIFLYDNVLQIPLLMRVPGVGARRITALARITDVMPTLLQLTGVTATPVDGRSLVPLMNGVDDRREVYAESIYPQRMGWSPLLALRDDRYKFIEAPRPELYDLDVDPFEQRNIFADRPTIVDAMRRRLVTVTTSARGDRQTSTVPPEVRERLAALGYVSGVASAPAGTRTLPDPKDCIGALDPAGHDETALSRTHPAVVSNSEKNTRFACAPAGRPRSSPPGALDRR